MWRSPAEARRQPSTCPTASRSSAFSARPTTRRTTARSTFSRAASRSETRAIGEGGATAGAAHRAFSPISTAAAPRPFHRRRPLVAKLHGVNPRDILRAQSSKSSALFRDHDRAAVRQAAGALAPVRPPVFGLGIPPAQYEALAGAGDMAGVMASARAARLWLSASGTIISPGRLRPRLCATRTVRCRLSAARTITIGFVTRVRGRGAHPLDHRISASAGLRSRDRYVLLDAQDWMTDRSAQCAVERDHPHGRPRRARDLPDRRRADLLPGSVPRRPSSTRWHY